MAEVPLTIPAALRRAVERFGDHEALVADGRRLTFRELEDEAAGVARALIASGIEPGDRIAIWAPNGATWVIASFGIYAAGAVQVPLNTRFRGEEAGHVLHTSRAKLLLTVTNFLDTDCVALLEGVGGLDDLDEIVVFDGAVPAGATSFGAFLARGERVAPDEVRAREDAIRPDDLSDLIFTSGTTGAPKGAMLTHGASTRTYWEWSGLVDLREGDRYLVVYPLFHTGGLKSGVLACVLRGATIHPEAVFDVSRVMKTVADERITMLPGPPTVFQSILNDPNLSTYDLSSVRSSVTGAAVVPVEVIRQMHDVLGIGTIITGYGLTETTGTVSMCRHDDAPEVIALTVGRPLPGVDVRVVDDDGRDVSVGEPGELLVRGFNVMTGYFNDEVATRDAIDADGWLKTGDIGFVDDGGNLHITDRKKDMFIVGGFNAYPAEIESMMLRNPSVAQVAVVGIPDPRLGEVGAAFVVPASGADPDADAIVSWCRANMANFKVPRRVEFVDALPTNPSGKIMKFKLREQIAGS
ncbi:MAG: FadD3 family acyl-CoA ligase [Acidimicrobiia bacterium]